MEATSTRLKEIIAEQLCLAPSEVQDNETLSGLGADSLDLIEIEMTVEEEFCICFPNEVAPKEGKTTVAEFIAVVAELEAMA